MILGLFLKANNRVSHLRKIEKTAKEIILAHRLPESFNEALALLVECSGLSKKAICEFTRINYSTLCRWIDGEYAPSEKNQGVICKLEDLFCFRAGTLEQRFPQRPGYSIKRREGVRTDYGKKVQKLSQDPYRYNRPCKAIKEEWHDLVHFFTVAFFLDDKERNSKWRVKPKRMSSSNHDKWYAQASGGICSIAAIKWAMISAFLGFLMLPHDQGGCALAERELSLALLSDPELVVKYINFRRDRSGCFTSETGAFLHFCAMLLRKK
jgi:hypothetical protein